jgi:hypothetical protein
MKMKKKKKTPVPRQVSYRDTFTARPSRELW